MIYAMTDNCIIICLCLLNVFTAKNPVLLVMAAGLFVVVETADFLGFRLRYLKAAFCLAFAFLSGSWSGFLVFTTLWPGNPVLLTVVPGILYAADVILFSGEELTGHFIAEQMLPVLLVMAGNLLLFRMKQLIAGEQKKKEVEQEHLRALSVSEMNEKKMNRQLAQQSFLADRNARLTERENISRNIHNSVGHTITAAIMTLDAADMLYDTKPEEARKKMNDANERIRGSLESIRRAVRTLDQESENVPMTDLIAGLQGIMDDFVMDTERSCRFLPDPFPEGMEITHEHMEFLTGVLQEFLTNGVKHGGADSFLVQLTGDSAHIRLTVVDNGKSDFSETVADSRLEQGFGLKKILSYAKRCGGFAEFRNEDGFRSLVELPVEKKKSVN